VNRVLLILLAFVVVLPVHGTSTPALVPAYSASYSQTDDLLKQIVVELRFLRQDVQALRIGGLPPNVPITAQAAIANKCVQCHGALVADEKGASFVLVEKDGKSAELSITEKRRVVREVEQGRMPKPPITLTPEERTAILTLKEELRK